MSDKKTAEEKHEFFVGPGETLRQTREKAGLTLEDVANKLFLSKQRVIAIESDDYSKLDSFIYIKGYLRGYAKLLGLDEDDIIERFNKLGLQEQDVQGSTRVVLRPQGRQKIKKRRRGIHWLDIIAVIVLILLAVLWWFSKSVDKEKPTAQRHIVQQMIVPS
jgi:cytoskeleton protein RodZ